MAYAGLALSAYQAMQQGKGGGSGGGGGGGGTKALEDAMRAQTATKATERPLEEIKPATDTTEQTAKYFSRMAAAIDRNGAMKQVASDLLRDMQAGTGRIQEEPKVSPLSTESPGPGAFSPKERYDVLAAGFGGSPSYQQIIEEPTEEEEKERSSFVNLRDFR